MVQVTALSPEMVATQSQGEVAAVAEEATGLPAEMVEAA